MNEGGFKSDDGTFIHYEVMGEGSPLIFSYGLVCRKEHWQYQIDFFKSRYQIITFDYRGHHQSDFPQKSDNLSIEWCAKDLVNLIEHLRLKEAVCIGHSLGVPVSVLASLASSKIKALVLICGSMHNPFHHMFNTNKLHYLLLTSQKMYKFFPKTLSTIWGVFTKSTNRISYSLTSRFGFNPNTALKRDIVGYLESVNKIPFHVFISLISDYAKFDGRVLLEKISVPTLVIAGSKDVITPLSVMKELSEKIVKSSYVVIEGGSHNTHSDFPVETNLALSDFFKKIKYGIRDA